MRLRPDYVGSLRTGLVLLLSLVLAVAACAGITYWAWQGSLLGVVLSALAPGFCLAALAAGEAWLLDRAATD